MVRGSELTLGRAGRALQLHPLEPVLYILLAQHYLDPLPPSHKRPTASSNPTTTTTSSTFSIENIPPARKTLLLGLRFLPENRDLWVEYIKLEVGWVEALRRRWRVLGILDEVERGVKKEDGEVEGAEGFQLDPPTNDADADADAAHADDERDTGKGAFGESGESARKQLVDGQLVLTVLNNSFTRPGLKDDLGYRLRLIELFRGYPTGLRGKLLDCVYGNIKAIPGLRRDYMARRVVLESGLFDRVYDPEVDEREVGVKVVDPVMGESGRIAVEGEEKVKVISRVVNAFKADQEDVEGELVEGEERERWRAGWDEVVGDWILRWAGRMREDEDDLVSLRVVS
jgi:U3 small nucleolar RNA-associated protein 6